MDAYSQQALIWSPAPPWAGKGAARFSSNTATDYCFEARGGNVAPSAVDAVWMRRWPRAAFPTSFGEGEIFAAKNELGAYYRGALTLLPQHAFWANSLQAQELANYKLQQLKAAQEVGLKIPTTLATNSAEEAKLFIERSSGQKVIYKPFYTFQWQEGKKSYHSVTSVVELSDLDDADQLMWSPGIFQHFVEKSYEVRASVFGRTCVCAKLSNQDPIDWRTSQDSVTVEPYDLPPHIKYKIHDLMDQLGIVMGMIDIIVTHSGDYVFLEVNEQGQFLWIEDACKELTLLDTCAQFFASKNKNFASGPTPPVGLTLADFYASPAFEDLHREDQEFRAAGGVHNLLLIREAAAS